MANIEMIKVFDWLQHNMNEYDLFEFKLEGGIIVAYFKSNGLKFAHFYIDKIREIIELEGENDL